MRKVVGLALAGAMIAGGIGTAFAQSNGNGPTGWQEGRRATHALNMLEDQGYTQFSHFRADGQNFTADVLKDGRTMQVMINPMSGQIQPANA